VRTRLIALALAVAAALAVLVAFVGVFALIDTLPLALFALAALVYAVLSGVRGAPPGGGGGA
jgi:hypothetical protein